MELRQAAARRLSILKHRDHLDWLVELCPPSTSLANIDVDCSNGLFLNKIKMIAIKTSSFFRKKKNNKEKETKNIS